MQTLNYTYRKGDAVAFVPINAAGLRLKRCYRDCRVIDLYPEHEPAAVRIRKGHEEIICRWIEIEPLVAHDQRRADERRAKVENNTIEIVAAWAGGARTVQEIAELLGVSNAKVISKFRQARRYGLLKENNDTTTH